MARIYSPIWDKLKATSKAEVTVSCDRLPTVKQAVKKLKTEENMLRRKLGKAAYGRLEIEEVCIDERRKLWKLSFVLSLNPRLL